MLGAAKLGSSLSALAATCCLWAQHIDRQRWKSRAFRSAGMSTALSTRLATSWKRPWPDLPAVAALFDAYRQFYEQPADAALALQLHRRPHAKRGIGDSGGAAGARPRAGRSSASASCTPASVR
jgi:hypothetical protein